MARTNIAQFEIPSLRILDLDGKVDAAEDPKLHREEAIALYRAMLLTRAVDEKGLKLQRQGRIGTFGPAVGQEAVSCASALALAEQDWLVPSFREVGAMFMRGWPVENFFLFYRGFEEGNLYPEGSRALPVSIIVGGHLPHAVGLAYAARQRGEKETAVLTFVGDGGTSEGDFHEALNFAGVWRSPVVFIVQNNQWAISIPREKQSAAQTLAQKAVGYGIPGIQVDGNDPLAVFKATREALARARQGEGPTLIEAVTYRLLMHTTSDDPGKYRDEEVTKAWWEKDPIARFRKYLRRRKILTTKADEALQAEVKAEVEDAVKRFEARLEWPSEQPFDHVFGTPHYTVEEQKQAFLESLAGGE